MAGLLVSSRYLPACISLMLKYTWMTFYQYLWLFKNVIKKCMCLYACLYSYECMKAKVDMSFLFYCSPLMLWDVLSLQPTVSLSWQAGQGVFGIHLYVTLSIWITVTFHVYMHVGTLRDSYLLSHSQMPIVIFYLCPCN